MGKKGIVLLEVLFFIGYGILVGYTLRKAGEEKVEVIKAEGECHKIVTHDLYINSCGKK